MLVGGVRELLGKGTLFGQTIFVTVADGGWFEPLGLMQLAPAAFFIIGLLVWAVRTRWTSPRSSIRNSSLHPSLISAEVRR
jgi:Na+-transporting NADH:ubiquinone oxidoreductase subunit D